MLLHNYLEKVLGSKTKVKILRVMYKFSGKDFSSRELARLVGVSHPGALKSLKDLEEMNLVSVKTHGKAYVFTLNKNSFLIKILEIFEIEKKTVDELLSDLKKIFTKQPIVSCALFGSIATAKESLRSDIDLLVITERKAAISEVLAAKQKDITEKFGNALASRLMTPREFKTKKSNPFMQGIIKNHILIAGKPLEAL